MLPSYLYYAASEEAANVTIYPNERIPRFRIETEKDGPLILFPEPQVAASHLLKRDDIEIVVVYEIETAALDPTQLAMEAIDNWDIYFYRSTITEAIEHDSYRPPPPAVQDSVRRIFQELSTLFDMLPPDKRESFLHMIAEEGRRMISGEHVTTQWASDAIVADLLKDFDIWGE